MENMEKLVIGFLESFYSDILENECREFCKINHTYIDKRVTRQLKTKYGTLYLKKPTVRYFAKNLNYTLFKKYERRCTELLEFEEKLYSSRIFKKDIKKVLGLSNISENSRKSLLSKYNKLYQEYLNKKKGQYDIIKVDATYFDYGYTVYFVFGIKGKTVKVLYYLVTKREECSTDWAKVITHIKKNDNYGAMIIVSDLKPLLKIQLLKLEKILLQNCIWHRIYSFIHRMSFTGKEKKHFFHEWYNYFLCCDYDKSSSYFDNFKQEHFRSYWNTEKNKKDIDIMKKQFYNDNWSYLGLPLDIQESYKVKNTMQNMDIEAYIAQFKKYLKKNSFYQSSEELQGKIYIMLSNLGYLEE